MSEQKLRLIFEALADSVETMTDDEVLEECRESGLSPDVVAEETRMVLSNALRSFRITKQP